MKNNNKKISIVRTSSSYLNFDSYNVQEVGFAKELVENGWVVDIFTANCFFKDEIRKIMLNYIDR